MDDFIGFFKDFLFLYDINFNISFIATYLSRINFLYTITISAFIGICLFGIFDREFSCLVFYRLGEKYIIELYNVLGWTSVGVEWGSRKHGSRYFCQQVVKQTPVARAPSVDALFYVADNHVAQMTRHHASHAFIEQNTEILPLQNTRVLKLINHYVVYARTYFLVDKRCIVVADHFIQ